jgi:hypothetical protein
LCKTLTGYILIASFLLDMFEKTACKVYAHSLAQYYNVRKNIFTLKKLLDEYGFRSVFVNHEKIDFN